MASPSLQSCPAVLALELAPGERPQRTTLTRDEADTLATLVADDLRALLPGVEDARLAVVGAHFDAVELLRPGFPAFATLDELGRRLPRTSDTTGVVALGSHEGRMPAEPLNPDRQYQGGPMRLLPWTLLAPPEHAQALAEAMEVELVGRGEVGARTADFLMRTLGMQLEHARYLSRNDLLALTCVQYEHAGLTALWSMVEAALLTPYREESALSARDLPLRYADGAVSVPSPSAWLAGRRDVDRAERAHALAGMLFELRQYAALLGAHHVALRFDSGDYDAQLGALVESVADADPAAGRARLFAHQAPGLGTVAISVAQPSGSGMRVLVHAFPLAGKLGPLCQALADRFDAASEPQSLDRIVLDAEGTALCVPADHSVH